MKFTSLGTTGLKVSQLGFGTYVFDNNIWRHDISDEEAIELMTYANSQGVNYFNSSLYYGSGKCEELLGKAIKEMKREDVVVCTKVGSHKDIRPLDNSPEFILKSTEPPSLLASWTITTRLSPVIVGIRYKPLHVTPL